MDLYQKLKVSPVINASGRMTHLGGCVLSEGVISAMQQGSSSYVKMAELLQRSGEYIAELAHVEAAYVTSSATSGIILSVAASITKDDMAEISRIPNVLTKKNKILIQKGHAVNFGAEITQIIEFAGGRVVEFGSVNSVKDFQLIGCIDDETAAIMYVQSHHAVQTRMLTLPEIVTIAHQRNIPVIVDAAAEEDITKYVEMGADLVCYSGTKALLGPSSGLIVGSKEYVNYCALQMTGIGRSFKVGKENVLGLVQAIEEHLSQNNAYPKLRELCQKLVDSLADYPQLKFSLVDDVAGREIVRARLYLVKDKMKINMEQFNELLKVGSPEIHARAHHADEGYIEFDPRPMQDSDVAIICKRIKEIVDENTY